MLACTALVGCSNEEDLLNGEQGVESRGEKGYIAVNLNAANVASRATGYKDGDVNENAVKRALFFFFDDEKQAYSVTTDGKSYLEPELDMKSETQDPSIEEISDPVLVIEKSKNVPPQYILAVLNAPSSFEKKNYSLSELETEIGAYNGDATNGFVMTNSVYKHAATGKAVTATEISIDNICDNDGEGNKDGALDHPVQIYVERVAAKVEVEAKDNATLFKTGVTFGQTPVYAKILGWNVTNIKNEANLLKKINTSWTDAALGFTGWNDAANFRSYWANTENTAAPTHPHNWGALNNNVAAANYFYENTGAAKSQLLVRAEFVDAQGNSLENTIAEWYGAKYTFEDLKVAFANAVSAKVFIKATEDAKEATSITDVDIDFFQASDKVSEVAEGRYLCYAKLAKDSEGKIFVDADGASLNTEAVNNILKAVRPAKIWEAGGYYYFNIDHLGTAEGLVRNHLYNITVTGISGLGTPVYDPEKIITPEKPKDDESYIAAKINILAWKVVNQEVELK